MAMDSSLPAYRRPIELENEPESIISYWHEAIELYSEQKYRQALIKTIRYINPKAPIEKDTKDDINFSSHHGSAAIQISITDTDFTISAPFLKIQNAKRIAIMRRVAEINFFPLNLCQIILKDNALCFYFGTAIDLCHPLKIYDVIREICISADDYDDEFIKKYHAEYYNTPQITRMSEQQQEAIWNSFKEIGEQYTNRITTFEQNLWIGSMWDIMAISMLWIANMPYINGVLRTELDEAIGIHFDTELDIDYRLDSGKFYLKALFENTTREQFLDNIYIAETFVSIKSRSSIEILMDVFEQTKKDIVTDLNNDNHLSAAYTMMVFFLRLMYEFSLDGNHQDEIFSTLEQAGGKSCIDAAPILWKTYDRFLNGEISGGPRHADGFLDKLLGLLH